MEKSITFTLTLQEQITRIENQIALRRKAMSDILSSEGAKIPEQLQGMSLEEWSHERSAYAILVEHLRHIESAVNSAVSFIINNLE